jgi:hypothetical protein
LGIQIVHECVQAWPGWREGKRDILGKAKDDGLKLRKSEDQGKERKEQKRKGWTRQA